LLFAHSDHGLASSDRTLMAVPLLRDRKLQSCTADIITSFKAGTDPSLWVGHTYQLGNGWRTPIFATSSGHYSETRETKPAFPVHISLGKMEKCSVGRGWRIACEYGLLSRIIQARHLYQKPACPAPNPVTRRTRTPYRERRTYLALKKLHLLSRTLRPKI